MDVRAGAIAGRIRVGCGSGPAVGIRRGIGCRLGRAVVRSAVLCRAIGPAVGRPFELAGSQRLGGAIWVSAAVGIGCTVRIGFAIGRGVRIGCSVGRTLVRRAVFFRARGPAVVRARVGRPAELGEPGVGDIGGPVLTPAGPLAADRDVMEDDLVASGRFVRIETRGQRTGLARSVTVGFVEDAGGPPGSILVAAGFADTAWASNLLADPACRVTLADRAFDARAEPLEPADHARAVRELILRYGTPAEGLGHGTSFRLRPVGEDGSE